MQIRSWSKYILQFLLESLEQGVDLVLLAAVNPVALHGPGGVPVSPMCSPNRRTLDVVVGDVHGLRANDVDGGGHWAGGLNRRVGMNRRPGCMHRRQRSMNRRSWGVNRRLWGLHRSLSDAPYI